MAIVKKFCDLRCKCVEHGITQLEIATHIGVTPQWISEIFNGRRESKTMYDRIKTAIDEILTEREAAKDEANTEQFAEAPEDVTIESPAELADGEEQNNGKI